MENKTFVVEIRGMDRCLYMVEVVSPDEDEALTKAVEQLTRGGVGDRLPSVVKAWSRVYPK